MAQKDKAVSTLTRGIGGLFKKSKVNYVKGYGKFISPSEESVDTIDDGNTVVKDSKETCGQLGQAILDMRWAQRGPGLVKKSLSSSLPQILSLSMDGEVS
ncbi:hypothetical protein OIU84_019396 [Salix udensis]|uniref:Uncharacterized protein n=1 Tax=Salix udensis TaxID=889485 RepID=A0AAD6KYS2_9ROSI|nr:hypothetical protein OIU84_019396 [Salix udensis]